MPTNISSLTFEEKVDEDYIYFLEHYRESFDTMRTDREKEICQIWLEKLATDTYTTTFEKQTRNIYLSQLVMSMNSRRLRAPFDVPPKAVPLSLDGVFKEVTTKTIAEIEKETKKNRERKKWKQLVRNRELEMVDLNHSSKDERTYVAFKTLPENSGVFAYVAVAMGGDSDCKWVNAFGRPIPAPVVSSLDLKVESARPPQKNVCEEQDDMFQLKAKVRSLLAKRQSPDARKSTLEFFQHIYSSIEQEMLREEDPYSTECHDPYIEKLLEKLLNDSKIPCNHTYNPKLFIRMKMLSTLKKRVQNIIYDIEERTERLSAIDQSSVSPLLNLINPAPNCSYMSEKMWQSALTEQPTSKMADALAKKYPVCLVKMLLALLTRERRNIINRLQEKHDKLVFSMKTDLKEEIRRGLKSYRAARKEWVDVMRVVMHYNNLKESLNAEKIDGRSNNYMSDYLLDTIRKEIADTRKRLEKVNGNNEKLQDEICDLNKELYMLTDKTEIERVQNEEELRDLQNDICYEQTKIVERTRTIEELTKMLKDWTRDDVTKRNPRGQANKSRDRY